MFYTAVKTGAHSYDLTFPIGRDHVLRRSLLALNCAILGWCDMGEMKLFLLLSLICANLDICFAPTVCWNLRAELPDFHKILLSVDDC